MKSSLNISFVFTLQIIFRNLCHLTKIAITIFNHIKIMNYWEFKLMTLNFTIFKWNYPNIYKYKTVKKLDNRHNNLKNNNNTYKINSNISFLLLIILLSKMVSHKFYNNTLSNHFNLFNLLYLSIFNISNTNNSNNSNRNCSNKKNSIHLSNIPGLNKPLTILKINNKISSKNR